MCRSTIFFPESYCLNNKLLIFCPVNWIHVWIFDFIDVPDSHHCQLIVQWPLTLQINVVRNLIVYLHSLEPHLSQPLDLLDKYQQLDRKVCSQELWLKNDLSNECKYIFVLLVIFLKIIFYAWFASYPFLMTQEQQRSTDIVFINRSKKI